MFTFESSTSNKVYPNVIINVDGWIASTIYDSLPSANPGWQSLYLDITSFDSINHTTDNITDAVWCVHHSIIVYTSLWSRRVDKPICHSNDFFMVLNIQIQLLLLPANSKDICELYYECTVPSTISVNS